MINTDKPTTSLVNTARADFAETWEAILTTWNTETRTWIDVSSLIDNTSKPATSITNIAKP